MNNIKYNQDVTKDAEGQSRLNVGLCDMVIIETPTFNYLWECSECKAQKKDTKKFCKNKKCQCCGKLIAKWIGVDDA